MEMQINVNTKIIYMDSAVPVMRAIENVKRDIRKVCCDSDEKGCDIVLIMENMQAEQFEIKCDNNMLVIYASDTLPVEACAKRANAIGAIQVQHRGDNEGLPDRVKLEAAMLTMKQ